MIFIVSRMKRVFLVIVALCAVTQAQVENEWTKVQSSFGVPFSKYPKILTRMFPYLIDRNMRRIAGGQAATWEQIPYQALLISDGFACGGSIISHNWILTAAHWFVN